jgi:hypothetical protein
MTKETKICEWNEWEVFKKSFNCQCRKLFFLCENSTKEFVEINFWEAINYLFKAKVIDLLQSIREA